VTGTDDSAPSPIALAIAAQLTVDQHQARPGRTYQAAACTQCTPQGCAQLDWAVRTLADLRARDVS
jgi:Tfp pilus assembly protein PilV